MANLTAETKNVEEIFQREYLIPEYQRPYSWEKEQCEQLVEDVASFSNEGKGTYFLGCMVVTRSEDTQGEWTVIDGQQRLTTLLLLVKALHKQAGTYHALERCYKKTDPKTGNFTDSMRLRSEVIEGDREKLAAILRDKNISDQDVPKNRFVQNYRHIKTLLDKMGNLRTSDDLERFISTLLKCVVLLPIECDGEQNALTIFNTLNNRGIALTDADVFKATLYKQLPMDQRADFINSWKGLLGDNGDHDYVDELFRIYMHILRARDEVIDKEKALRTYFLENKNKRLGKPSEVMKCLESYKAVDSWDCSPEVAIWWGILETYPNSYWEYPLYVFLDKHGVCKAGRFALAKEKEDELIRLIKATVRYCFIKGVVANTVNAIKDTIFKVCAAIAHDKDYNCHYTKNAGDDVVEFKGRLDKSDYGRYLKGLVLTNSALHPSQRDEKNRRNYSDFLYEKYDIEHILPRKWNHYDGWDKSTHEEDIDKLGNLIPLEKKLNIKASNEFFDRKKEHYRKSKISEVRKLCELNKWSPEKLRQRDEEVLQCIKGFFCY